MFQGDVELKVCIVGKGDVVLVAFLTLKDAQVHHWWRVNGTAIGGCWDYLAILICEENETAPYILHLARRLSLASVVE